MRPDILQDLEAVKEHLHIVLSLLEHIDHPEATDIAFDAESALIRAWDVTRAIRKGADDGEG